MFEHFTALQIALDDARPDRVIARMNRAEVRNAIDATMVEEFHELCGWLESEPRTLIITGTRLEDGRGIFASGADISQMLRRTRDDALRGVNSTVFDRIHKLPMPVIAALDGYALGGGAELAWAADFRVSTDQVRIGQPETGLGIIAAAGALWRLRELAGEAVAKELLLAGRILTAQEALDLHLVTRVCAPADLMDTAHDIADGVAKQDPLAVRLSKSVLHMPREAHPLVDNLAQAITFESEAKKERMQAFLDRKKNKK